MKLSITEIPTQAKHKLFGFVEILGVRIIHDLIIREQYFIVREGSGYWIEASDTKLQSDSLNNLLEEL